MEIRKTSDEWWSGSVGGEGQRRERSGGNREQCEQDRERPRNSGLRLKRTCREQPNWIDSCKCVTFCKEKEGDNPSVSLSS